MAIVTVRNCLPLTAQHVHRFGVVHDDHVHDPLEQRGVHWASIGWILPELHDPDGHEVRFYSLQHHTELAPDAVTIITDPRESSERHGRVAASQ